MLIAIPRFALTNYEYSHATAAPAPPVSRIFTVPDSDHEDEIVSIHSRESSLEIVDSHLRTNTYSVPSDSDYGSDPDDFRLEDDDYQTSSSPLGRTQDSAVTIPENIARPFGDASIEKGVSKGKTIDLNLQDPKLQVGNLKPAGEGSSQHDPIDLAEQSAPDAETTSPSPSHQDLLQDQTQTKVFVEVDMNETESEDEGPDELPIQSPYKRTLAGATSAIDGYDAVHNGPEGFLIKSQTGRNDLAGTANVAAGSNIADDDNDNEESEGDDDDVMNDEMPSDVDEANDLHDAKYAEESPMRCGRSSRETFFTQRVPSPSDAALARTPGKVESMPRVTTSSHSTSVPRPKATFAAFNWDAPPPTAWNAPPPATGYPMWRDDPSRYQYSTHSTSGYAVAPHTTYIGPVTQHPVRHDGQDAHEDLMTAQCVSSAEHLLHEAPMTTSTENPASRLHIANLVNSYSTELSRPAKRKASEMSLGNDEVEIGSAPLQHRTMSQDSPLPDAQPRDAPTTMETSIPAEEWDTPDVYANVAPMLTRASLIEEPVQKKLKTSSAPSNGVGKFLMGVAVGAVGLAATFLATIPANVQEEVRLGM